MITRDWLFFRSHELHNLHCITQSARMMSPGGAPYNLDRTTVFPKAFGKKLTVVRRRHNEIIRTVNQQNRNFRQLL